MMLPLKKKKIEKYVEERQRSGQLTSFDCSLAICAENQLLPILKACVFTKIEITVDFEEDDKSIGVQCRYLDHFVDIQMDEEAIGYSYAKDEPEGFAEIPYPVPFAVEVPFAYIRNKIREGK